MKMDCKVSIKVYTEKEYTNLVDKPVRPPNKKFIAQFIVDLHFPHGFLIGSTVREKVYEKFKEANIYNDYKQFVIQTAYINIYPLDMLYFDGTTLLLTRYQGSNGDSRHILQPHFDLVLTGNK